MFSLFPLILAGMSLSQTSQPVQPFPDVPKTHWAYAAVTDLHERGILKGYPGPYDRSTPYTALQSLIKAINNDDKAKIRELTTSQALENWLILHFSTDARQRKEALKQGSLRWKLWANYPLDEKEAQDWQEFNVKANRLPLGTETAFQRWVDKRDVIFIFVQEPQGWKVTQISARH